MDILDGLIEYIISANFATAKDTDIFKDYVPATPDDCICIMEYQGIGPSEFTPLSVRSVQLLVRSKTASEAKTKIWDIFKDIYREDLILELGTTKCILSMRCTPFKMQTDSQNRVSFVFNFGLTAPFN